MEKRLEDCEKRKKEWEKVSRGEKKREGGLEEGKLGREWEELEGRMRSLKLEGKKKRSE